MIIRPATGTGNKVIVQDQAGAAVLTTDDSGATLANGLALGTPASATLTNATFPAGHVVQTTLPARGTNYTTGPSEDPTWTDSVVTSTITPKFSNSSIISFLHLGAWFGGESSGDMGYGFRLKKAGTGVSNTYGSPLFGPIIQDEGHSIFYRNSPQANEEQHTHYFTR